MENKPEARYQRVEDIKEELQYVKNILVVGSARDEMIYKFETTMVVITSVISYAITFLGISGMQP
jgi:hypothetical protein